MSDTTESKGHVVVLGGGPGGYPAAFHAAHLGFKVTMIDAESNPGGSCLLRGCIPSKALLHVAKLLHETQAAGEWGLVFEQPALDLNKLRGWKDGIISKLSGGLAFSAKQREVNHIRGRGKFLDPKNIHVDKLDGSTEKISFDYCIVATGSRPAVIPSFPNQSPLLMDSTKALALADIPQNLLVVGGGYIGLEMGTVYAALGSHVTVVEATSGLLPGADRDLVEFLAKRLNSTFDSVLLNTKVLEVKEQAGKMAVKISGPDVKEADRVFDKVLVAVGRRPNSENIGLDLAGVQLDSKGFIKVDAQRRSNVPHILAIGDVAGEPMLAHKATAEGRVAAEVLGGLPVTFQPNAIPAVVFTDPEIAWCGVTEVQSRDLPAPAKVLKFPWAASGRATTLDRNDGMTKLIVDAKTERILGVGIVGVGAGEMIAEGTLAVELGARASDLKLTIHAHPTLSETMMETAETFFGPSTHFMPRK